MSWLPPLITEDNFPGPDPPKQNIKCTWSSVLSLTLFPPYWLSELLFPFGCYFIWRKNACQLTSWVLGCVTVDQQPDIMEPSSSRNIYFFLFVFFFYVFYILKKSICLSLLNFHQGRRLLTIIFTLFLQQLSFLRQKSCAIKWMKLIY